MKLFSNKSRFPRAHVCNALFTAAALVRTSLSLSGQHIFAVQISWSWNAIFLRRRRFCAHAQEAEPHRRRGPAWAGHVGVSDYPSYKMAEKQNQFSPSVPPLIPPPVSSPSSSSSVPPSSSASGVGFSSQSFQDQPLYSSVLPKSQRKDHTHRPPSMTTPTTGVPSPSTNQDTSSKAAAASKGRRLN